MGVLRRSGLQVGGPAENPGSGSLERIYLRLGDRLGQSLEREVGCGDSLAPRRTLARSVAVVISVAVYCATLGFIAAGVAVIIAGWSDPVVVFVGVAMCGVGVVTCPRPYRRCRVRGGVAPASLPQLNGVIAQVAGALGVSPPDVIAFDLRFNASWGQDGWRRRRVLRLGVPLLASLDAPQTLALLAHELAHERNGDARRGRVVGSSLASLASAVDLLASHRTRARQRMAPSIVLANMLLWLCSQPFRGLLSVQAHLLYRDSQRAEYLADDLAASVAGTDAVVALHDSMLAMNSVKMVIRRVALTDEHAGVELLDDIRAAACDSDPARQAERRQRARREQRRLDSTHPTTASRIAVLQQRPPRSAAINLDEIAQTSLVNELRSVLQQHIPALIERDRGHLYSG